MTDVRQAAEHEPIARVLPMLSVPHLDREFDYLVSADQSDDAQPGVRVRVRFHGRLVDAFILERRSETDHVGRLGWLDRVVSGERVLTPEVWRLVDAVAARYAGSRADVLRLAVPPRHATVEKQAVPDAPAPTVPPVDPVAWGAYGRGTHFLDALAEGRAARAVWQALPGEQWADRLAEAGQVVFMTSAMGSIAENGTGGADAYRASKAALNMLAKSFSLRHQGTTVTLMHPGWVKTDMGGANAPVDVATSAKGMAVEIGKRQGAGDLAYVDYTGRAIAW